MYCICFVCTAALVRLHFLLFLLAFVSQDKLKEEKQMKVKARIVSALQCGLKVLDDAFEELIFEQVGGTIDTNYYYTIIH